MSYADRWSKRNQHEEMPASLLLSWSVYCYQGATLCGSTLTTRKSASIIGQAWAESHGDRWSEVKRSPFRSTRQIKTGILVRCGEHRVYLSDDKFARLLVANRVAVLIGRIAAKIVDTPF